MCWVVSSSLERRPASLQTLLCLSLHTAENQAAGDTHVVSCENMHRVCTELASQITVRNAYHAINMLASHLNSIICAEISASGSLNGLKFNKIHKGCLLWQRGACKQPVFLTLPRLSLMSSGNASALHNASSSSSSIVRTPGFLCARGRVHNYCNTSV